MIARYSRVRQLVDVNVTWPYLRWKEQRYRWPWYRKPIIYLSYGVYLCFSLAGILLLILPEAIPIKAGTTEKALIVTYLLITSSLVLIDGLKLGLASDLIKAAAEQAPVQPPSTRSELDFDVDEHD
ncbi:hypothetical protein GCM10007387_33920 [Pseudoduganella albidiflava]|nr:hypothetical protein GCM10007387_33920 [Pseudoduganella albidiflava]